MSIEDKAGADVVIEAIPLEWAHDEYISRAESAFDCYKVFAHGPHMPGRWTTGCEIGRDFPSREAAVEAVNTNYRERALEAVRLVPAPPPSDPRQQPDSEPGAGPALAEGTVGELRGPVREAVSRLIAGAFRRDGERLGDDKRPRFSIPARPDEDDDLVVSAAIKRAADEIEQLRVQNAMRVTAYCQLHELYCGTDARAEAAEAKAERMRVALELHQNWHLAQEEAADGTGGADAYVDSAMCDATLAALASTSEG
jgi:hypothetical protein